MNAFEQALHIQTEALDENHRSIAITLSYLGMLHQHMGNYEQAHRFLQRALEIRRRRYGNSHPSTASSLNELGLLLQERGEYERALALYREALENLEKSPGENQIVLSRTLANLATLYQSRGEYDRALDLYGRELEIKREALGDRHPDLVVSLNNLAGLHEIRGDYAQALILYQHASKILENTLGKYHPLWATTLSNTALLYQSRGEHERALALHLQALEIRQQALGKNSPDVARSLSDLATLYRERGEYERAAALYQQALGIFEKTLGRHHPLWGATLNNMALVYQDQGKYERALPMHLSALEIRRKALGEDHPDVAESLNNLGYIYYVRVAHEQALPLFQRALNISRTALGEHHPRVARILDNLAVLYWETGRSSEALDSLQQSLQVTERSLATLVFASSEDEKHARFATHGFDASLAVAWHLQEPDDPRAARLALETVLRRKAFVLGATARELRYLRREVSNRADKYLLDRLAQARSRLANLLLRGPAENMAAYKTQTEAVWQQIDELEGQISQRSSAYRAATTPVTVADVQARLGAGTALVEIVMYAWPDWRARPGPEQWSAPRYAAYVLTAQGPPRVVDLGPADVIDENVRTLQAALALHRANVHEASRVLDTQVMQPVRALLGDARRVYLSPDGALNLVPFEALLDENGRYLVERFSFTYLDSGRNLVQHASRKPTGAAMMVVANPAFDASRPAVASAAPVSTGRRSRDMDSHVFSPLPGTAREAAMLRRLFPHARVLTGEAATETAVKSAQAPLILHIATHGFFLPDQDIGPSPERVFWSRHEGSRLAANGSPVEMPLVRSGLALAGANQLRSGNDDGILTALELSSMNLDGTQLVVLSACDTGMGSTETGKGVFGLRRALVLAGAATQVVSLWKVDDAATTDLMNAYYERLLAGEGRSEALHEVQRAFLRDPERAHPYYWGGFIVSGSPLPLP